MMHINWRMPLGGVLSGILPNPGFSSEAYIQNQVFARRPFELNYISALVSKSNGLHSSLLGSYVSGTGTAGVDNTAQTVVTVPIPLNTLTQLGDRLHIRVYWRGDTGGNITATSLLGPAGSEVQITHTTDAGGATQFLNESFIHYVDNTHANIIEIDVSQASGLGALTAPNVSGFTWNAAQQLIITQDQVANNHIVVFAVLVDTWPKGT